MKRLHIIYIIATALLLSSCDSFLDVQPIGKVIAKTAAYTPASPRSAAIKKTIRNGKIIIVKGDAAYDLDGKKH